MNVVFKEFKIIRFSISVRQGEYTDLVNREHVPVLGVHCVEVQPDDQSEVSIVSVDQSEASIPGVGEHRARVVDEVQHEAEV